MFTTTCNLQGPVATTFKNGSVEKVFPDEDELPSPEAYEKAILMFWLTTLSGYMVYRFPALILGGFLWLVTVDLTMARTLTPAYSTLDIDDDDDVKQEPVPKKPDANHEPELLHEDIQTNKKEE